MEERGERREARGEGALDLPRDVPACGRGGFTMFYFTCGE